MRPLFVCCLGLFALFTFSAPAFASAQTRTGFAEPDSLQNLLDYRLPDWSYRTWDLNFNFNSSGLDSRRNDSRRYDKRTATRLGSGFWWYRESERSTHYLRAALDGNYSHRNSQNQDNELSGHQLSGLALFEGEIQHYLGEGPFSLVASLGEAGNYSETVETRRDTLVGTEKTELYNRGLSQDYTAGLGWGRIRNVIPLIRAQRLSERLKALGREPLSPAEIQQVARFLAAQPGYSRVFDRPDRFFWQDVLQPLLHEDTPLSPLEVFYLTEVLQENVGTRFQGWQARSTFQFQQDAGFMYGAHRNFRTRGLGLDLTWYRNLSLNHQIKAAAAWQYLWQNQGDGTREESWFQLGLAHLWCLADRHLWETNFSFNSSHRIYSDYQRQSLNLSSRLETFIEDQLSLVTMIGVSREWTQASQYEIKTWNWNVALGLAYHLDRVLF